MKDLKLFSLLFNLSQLMNTKNEQVAAENFSKAHLFSISGCHVTPVCPSIYLIKMTIFSQMAPAHLNILIEMTVNTHRRLDTHMQALTHAYSCTHTHCSRGPKANSYISTQQEQTNESAYVCVCVCAKVCVCVWGGVRVHACIWIQIATESQCQSDVSSAAFSQNLTEMFIYLPSLQYTSIHCACV